MNVSKPKQRTLHALAQGDHVASPHDISGKITHIRCYNHDDYLLLGCTLTMFSRPKNKGLVHSRQGRLYRIPMAGLKAMRPQADNR